MTQNQYIFGSSEQVQYFYDASNDEFFETDPLRRAVQMVVSELTREGILNISYGLGRYIK